MRAEDVVLATEILTYVVAAVSTACSLLLLYVVRLHSSREMGAYKWSIIFAQLPEPIVRIGINFVGLALYGVSSGIVAIIVFRFRQAATGKVLFGLLTPKQFYLACMFVLVISPVILIVPCNMVVETSREVIYERIIVSNPDVIPILRDRIVVGIKSLLDLAVQHNDKNRFFGHVIVHDSNSPQLLVHNVALSYVLISLWYTSKIPSIMPCCPPACMPLEGDGPWKWYGIGKWLRVMSVAAIVLCLLGPVILWVILRHTGVYGGSVGFGSLIVGICALINKYYVRSALFYMILWIIQLIISVLDSIFLLVCFAWLVSLIAQCGGSCGGWFWAGLVLWPLIDVPIILFEWVYTYILVRAWKIQRECEGSDFP